MKKNYIISLILIFFLISETTKATTINVCSNNELQIAIANAQPGDTIFLCDGVWSDLKLIINKNGTASLPIIVAAKNLGKVTISGNSYISIEGSYIHVKGFRWENYGDPTPLEAHIEIALETSNCKISEMVFEKTTQVPLMKWLFNIVLKGKEHEVFNTAFLGKYGRGAQLIVRKGGEGLKHNLHHLYFSREVLVDNDGLRINGGESLQIGSISAAFPILADDVTAHHLFFENANGEGEIISNKGNRNVYTDIVMKGCQGAFSLRSGDDCQINNLFIDAQDKPKAIGLVFFGDNHIVKNVFISRVYDRWKGGLFLESLSPHSYDMSDNVSIENVTIMSSHDAISIHGQGSSNTHFKSIIAVAKNSPLIDRVLFADDVNSNAYTFTNSFLFGQTNVSFPSGAQNIDPQLVPVYDGLYIPSISSPAFGTGSQMIKLPIYKNKTGPQTYNWYQADEIVSISIPISIQPREVLPVTVAYFASEKRKMKIELKKGNTIIDFKYFYVDAGSNVISHEFTMPNNAVDIDNYSVLSFITTPNGGWENNRDWKKESVNVVASESDLIGYWPFNGNTNDVSGNNHHATAYYPSYSTGQVGKGMNTNGTYAKTVSNSFDLGEFTLMTWIKPSNISGTWRVIMEKDRLKSDWYGLYQKGNKIHFRWSNDNSKKITTSTIVLPTNTFTHVAATFNGSIAKIYINGVLKQSKQSTPIVPSNSHGELRFGINGDGNEAFQGIIDEVKIFNQALTGTQIQGEFSVSGAGSSGEGIENTVKLYPNPTSEKVTLELPFIENDWSYQLITISGQIIKKGTFKNTTSTLSLKDLTNGIYFLQLTSDQKTEVHRIMKK